MLRGDATLLRIVVGGAVERVIKIGRDKWRKRGFRCLVKYFPASPILYLLHIPDCSHFPKPFFSPELFQFEDYPFLSLVYCNKRVLRKLTRIDRRYIKRGGIFFFFFLTNEIFKGNGKGRKSVCKRTLLYQTTMTVVTSANQGWEQRTWTEREPFFLPSPPCICTTHIHAVGARPKYFTSRFRILGIGRFDASPNCPANIFRSITVEKQFPKFFLFKKSFFNAFIRNDRTRIKLRFLFGIVKEKFEKRKIPSREGNPFTR